MSTKKINLYLYPMSQFLNLALPEFVFLDGNSPKGDTLQNRTVIQHIRSNTMLEVFNEDQFPILSLKEEIVKKEFNYLNQFNIEEKHLIAVHFSFAEEDELEEVLNKTINWYCEYLAWEDGNIIEENNASKN